jgi:Flp pilus assembly pilin Flp
MRKRARLLKDCRGQSAVEYAVVLALIVIVGVAVLLGTGQGSRDRWASVNAILSRHHGPIPTTTVAPRAAADQDSSVDHGTGQAPVTAHDDQHVGQ